MSKPKVSVVMPSLNVAEYIEVCIESVLNQTLKDIEVICVDAGSTDGTLEILEKYAQCDSRVKVLHSEKKSYGYQVNLGFNESKGEYFAIVETDDIINLKMYETLYAIAVDNNVDLVKADFCRFVIEDGIMKRTYAKIAKPHMYGRILYAGKERKDIITGASLYTWSGIYKREFLEKNGIFHNETPGASYQDNGFWFQTMAMAQRVYFVDEPFYMLRRDNPNSSINNKAKVYCIRDEYEFILDYLKQRPEVYNLVIPFYWWARFGAYRYNHNRIANEYKPEFISHFHNVFVPVWNSTEIDLDIFSKTAYHELKMVVTDPDLYNKKKMRTSRREEEKRTYLNRFKWCLEDNGVLYTIGHILKRIADRLLPKLGILTVDQKAKKYVIRPITKYIGMQDEQLLEKMNEIIFELKKEMIIWIP